MYMGTKQGKSRKNAVLILGKERKNQRKKLQHSFPMIICVEVCYKSFRNVPKETSWQRYMFENWYASIWSILFSYRSVTNYR